MNQYLSKVRQLENDKSDQSSQYQRRLEEFQRDKDQDIDRLKSIHRCLIIKHCNDTSHSYTDMNENWNRKFIQTLQGVVCKRSLTVYFYFAILA